MTLVYRPNPLVKYPDEFLRPRITKLLQGDPDEGHPAGTDIFGSWVNHATTAIAGVDDVGAWIDGDAVSSYAGVDGTGPWVTDT